MCLSVTEFTILLIIQVPFLMILFLFKILIVNKF